MIVVSNDYISHKSPRRIDMNAALGYFYLVGDLIFSPAELSISSCSLQSAYEHLRMKYPNVFRDVGCEYYPHGVVTKNRKTGYYEVTIDRRYRYYVGHIRKKLPIILKIRENELRIFIE